MPDVNEVTVSDRATGTTTVIYHNDDTGLRNATTSETPEQTRTQVIERRERERRELQDMVRELSRRQLDTETLGEPVLDVDQYTDIANRAVHQYTYLNTLNQTLANRDISSMDDLIEIPEVTSGTSRFTSWYSDNTAATRVRAIPSINFAKYFEDGSAITREALDAFITRSLQVIDERKESMARRSLNLDDQAALVREEVLAVENLRREKERLWTNFPEDPENKKFVLNQIVKASADYFTLVSVLEDNYPIITPTPDEYKMIGKIFANRVKSFMQDDAVRQEMFKELQADVQQTIQSNFYSVLDAAKDSTMSFLRQIETYVYVKPEVEIGKFPNSRPNESFTSEDLYKGLLSVVGSEGCPFTTEQVTMRYANGLFNGLIKSAMQESDLPSEVSNAIAKAFTEELKEILLEKSFSIIRWDKIIEGICDPSCYQVSIYRSRYDYFKSNLGIKLTATRKFAIDEIFETIKSRSRFIRLMRREMIEPYERYDRNRCEQVYAAVSHICSLDGKTAPANTIYSRLKTLDKEYSFFDQYEFDQDGTSIETCTIEEAPFFFRTKNFDIRAMQLIYTLIKAAQHNQNCLIRLRTETREESSSTCLRIPMEYMIKLMGITEFRKFVEDRRDTEILAFAVAATFKNRCPDAVTSKDIDTYWNSSRFTENNSVNYVADICFGHIDRRGPWAKEYRWVADFVNDPVLREILETWDRSKIKTGKSCFTRFNERLIAWAKEGYHNSFLTTDADKKLLGIIRHQYAWMRLKDRAYRTRKFWPMIKSHLVSALVEILNDNELKYDRARLYEEITIILRDKHLLFGRQDLDK